MYQVLFKMLVILHVLHKSHNNPIKWVLLSSFTEGNLPKVTELAKIQSHDSNLLLSPCYTTLNKRITPMSIPKPND